MIKTIQTLIWAILLSSGIFMVAQAEAKQSDNSLQQATSQDQTQEPVISQREDLSRDSDELKKVNLGGTVGIFLPSDSDEFDPDNEDFDFDSIDIESGFGGSAYAGYRFNNFLSTDLEFVAFTGDAEPFDSSYTSVGFFVNPRYTLNLGINSNASPYVFVSPGIGVAGVGFGDDLESQISDDGLNTGVALQIKAGGGLPLSQSVDVFGQARYLNAFKVYEISSTDDEQGFSSFSLEAGLNFKL